jgi:hypothetical protein
MKEGLSGSAVICSDGAVANGSVVLGNITTPVVRPVDVQFGGVQTANANFGGDWSTGISGFAGGILPPPAGLSAMLKTQPDLIPVSLTTALGCSTATDPTVQSICAQAQAKGGVYNQVFALAQEAGAITNFNLLSWTQAVKFQLINPLLGNNCYIGSNSNPVVVNPSLSLAPGGSFTLTNDPRPTVHPDTEVIPLTKAIASDTTFSAPGVLGCGPGGVNDVAVDVALNASSGLPAASGNSLTLTGKFSIAACTAPEDTSLPQPQDAAADLLAAFKASTNGEHSVQHQITMSQIQTMFHGG